jgi:hypothetical protein
VTRKFSNTHVDVIRLTLDEVADADVIKVLQSVPFGSKSRMVKQAIRLSCRVVGDVVVVGSEDKKEVEVVPPGPAKQTPMPAAAPIAIEVDTF